VAVPFPGLLPFLKTRGNGVADVGRPDFGRPVDHGTSVLIPDKDGLLEDLKSSSIPPTAGTNFESALVAWLSNSIFIKVSTSSSKHFGSSFATISSFPTLKYFSNSSELSLPWSSAAARDQAKVSAVPVRLCIRGLPTDRTCAGASVGEDAGAANSLASAAGGDGQSLLGGRGSFLGGATGDLRIGGEGACASASGIDAGGALAFDGVGDKSHRKSSCSTLCPGSDSLAINFLRRCTWPFQLEVPSPSSFNEACTSRSFSGMSSHDFGTAIATRQRSAITQIRVFKKSL
jgi:hypothetical protein